MAVNRWQPLWLLLCFGLAVAVNHLMRPRVPYTLSPGERTMATGTLWLDDHGQRRRVELTTVHVVAVDLRRPFADALEVRELWLRSPEQDDQVEPDFELFVDFAKSEPDGGWRERGPKALAGSDLPILTAAVGSTTRSRIRFAGAEQPSLVDAGSLRIREALPVEAASMFRIEGELELEVHEQGASRSVHGSFNARLLWD